MLKIQVGSPKIELLILLNYINFLNCPLKNHPSGLQSITFTVFKSKGSVLDPINGLFWLFNKSFLIFFGRFWSLWGMKSLNLSNFFLLSNSLLQFFLVFSFEIWLLLRWRSLLGVTLMFTFLIRLGIFTINIITLLLLITLLTL